MLNELKLANAIISGDEKKIKELIQDEMIDLNFRDNFGISALDLAIDKKNIKIVDHLLANGADFRKITNDKYWQLQILRGSEVDISLTSIKEKKKSGCVIS